VQGRARPDAIASAAADLLDDSPRRAAMLERFRELRARLGGGTGAVRVADMAVELIARPVPR
jgi:lipid A disaccharide synthetase